VRAAAILFFAAFFASKRFSQWIINVKNGLFADKNLKFAIFFIVISIFYLPLQPKTMRQEPLAPL